MSDQTIVLTGFMGTGKSTAAHAVAYRLNRSLVDMDTLIEQRTGWPIPRLFAERGESFFRAVEKGIALELSLRHTLVVATGGGTFVDSDSQQAMLQQCFVVCLMALPRTLEQRLQSAGDRPLAGHWQDLYERRRAVYESLPHQVWTDGQTPTQVAQEVITLWNAFQ